MPLYARASLFLVYVSLNRLYTDSDTVIDLNPSFGNLHHYLV